MHREFLTWPENEFEMEWKFLKYANYLIGKLDSEFKKKKINRILSSDTELRAETDLYCQDPYIPHPDSMDATCIPGSRQ